MWQRFLDWLPDLQVGAFEVRDLLALTVGSLGVLLAYLAIKLGRAQANISARQAAIAENQYRIQMIQLGQQPAIELIPGLTAPDGVGPFRTVLSFRNDSAIPLVIRHWRVSFHHGDYEIVLRRPRTGEALPRQRFGPPEQTKRDFYSTARIEIPPTERAEIAILDITAGPTFSGELLCDWWADTPYVMVQSGTPFRLTGSWLTTTTVSDTSTGGGLLS